MDRREFLATAGRPRGIPVAAATSAASDLPWTLLRFQRRAMATQFEIAVPADTPQAHAAAAAALDEIDRIEDLLTVYRDDSEASHVNQHAAQGPVQVSPELFDLLTACRTLHRSTLGAFDPTCGAVVEAWGFLRGPARVPQPADLRNSKRNSGMRWVELDANRRTVRFLREGLKLNFGSIGKGYALDQAARLLRDDWGIACALLQGGGSSMRALGVPPHQPAGWEIRLAHPNQPAESVGLLCLKDAALGVSATTFRGLEFQGRRLGHLLDPRTGWPTEHWLGAIAVTSTAASADAWATAAYILGELELVALESSGLPPALGLCVFAPLAPTIRRFGMNLQILESPTS